MTQNELSYICFYIILNIYNNAILIQIIFVFISATVTLRLLCYIILGSLF